MRHLLPRPNMHLIGHRGVAGLRPENTLCSFEYAAQLGLTWIEFDVQLSKDNIWVVIHDETLNRTTNGQGNVCDFNASVLTSLEAGLWFRPSYPNQHIPTLQQTLELAKRLRLFCNIELKVPQNCSRLYVEKFLDFAKQNRELLTDNTLLSSFDLECAIQLTTQELPVAYLTEECSAASLDIFSTYNFAALNADAEKFNKHALQAAQSQGIPVFLYTVNDPITAQYWLDLGVSGLFTDRPDLLQTS